MLHVDILTLFPRICEGALSESMMRKAQVRGHARLEAHDLRTWTTDKHRMADDSPYGGGQGMVLKPEPIFAAVEELRGRVGAARTRVVYLSPAGRRLSHAVAQEYAAGLDHLILIAGHYEGVDQRVIDHLVDEEISIGDFVLTNGAIAAVVLADAVVRLIPGVLGDESSAGDDSFATGLLEFPHYTRPMEFRGWSVPEILLSGHHAEIDKWRRAQALERTRRQRPDLLDP